ncbi:Protein Tanc1 [Manis pentadactyla]|nr:Protein Tanc1 [Manis pentadactyla]KAI5279374.1 Protein Tanc1 [Manis pentadactyla]
MQIFDPSGETLRLQMVFLIRYAYVLDLSSQAKEVIREYGLHDAQERMSLDGLLVMRNLDSNKCLVQMNFREWLDST